MDDASQSTPNDGQSIPSAGQSIPNAGRSIPNPSQAPPKSVGLSRSPHAQATLTLAVGNWSPNALSTDRAFIAGIIERATAVATTAGAPVPRSTSSNGTTVISPLTPRGLLIALDLCAQRDDLVCGFWLTPPANPVWAGGRLMRRAREASTRFAVGPEREPAARQHAAAVGALLALHITVVQARTPAQWRALAAVDRHGTANQAAQALGISHQAVSKSLRRAHAAETSGTWLALVALLSAAEPR